MLKRFQNSSFRLKDVAAEVFKKGQYSEGPEDLGEVASDPEIDKVRFTACYFCLRSTLYVFLSSENEPSTPSLPRALRIP